MEYQLVFQTSKSVEASIAALQEALTERKFSVLWHLHINQKLAEKGLTIEPDVHVLEVCSAPRAKQAIDLNADVAAFLPCKITVTAVGGTTRISLTRPTLLMELLRDTRLKPLAEEVEKILVDAIEAAA